MVAKLTRKLKPSVPRESGHWALVSVHTHPNLPFQINNLRKLQGYGASYKEFECAPRFLSG